MYVLTVDQIDSQRRADRVEPALRDIERRFGTQLLAPPERTAGDEFQVATEQGPVALDLLTLVRDGGWSVGLGVGDARTPSGASVRAMSGTAFVNAREAVTTAKKRPTRFALVADAAATAALDPLIRLLLTLRERRTPEGWELFDLLDDEPHLTLTDAAGRLGISVQAASQRAHTAGLRLDREARDALGTMLTDEGGRIGR